MELRNASQNQMLYIICSNKYNVKLYFNLVNRHAKVKQKVATEPITIHGSTGLHTFTTHKLHGNEWSTHGLATSMLHNQSLH
jgi:hypothetical protein